MRILLLDMFVWQGGPVFPRNGCWLGLQPATPVVEARRLERVRVLALTAIVLNLPMCVDLSYKLFSNDIPVQIKAWLGVAISSRFICAVLCAKIIVLCGLKLVNQMRHRLYAVIFMYITVPPVIQAILHPTDREHMYLALGQRILHASGMMVAQAGCFGQIAVRSLLFALPGHILYLARFGWMNFAGDRFGIIEAVSPPVQLGSLFTGNLIFGLSVLIGVTPLVWLSEILTAKRVRAEVASQFPATSVVPGACIGASFVEGSEVDMAHSIPLADEACGDASFSWSLEAARNLPMGPRLEDARLLNVPGIVGLDDHVAGEEGPREASSGFQQNSGPLEAAQPNSQSPLSFMAFLGSADEDNATREAAPAGAQHSMGLLETVQTRSRLRLNRISRDILKPKEIAITFAGHGGSFHQYYVRDKTEADDDAMSIHSAGFFEQAAAVRGCQVANAISSTPCFARRIKRQDLLNLLILCRSLQHQLERNSWLAIAEFLSPDLEGRVSLSTQAPAVIQSETSVARGPKTWMESELFHCLLVGLDVSELSDSDSSSSKATSASTHSLFVFFERVKTLIINKW